MLSHMAIISLVLLLYFIISEMIWSTVSPASLPLLSLSFLTQVPTPEIRAHSLYFDLSAYGVEALREHRNPPNKPGFHLKIYGTFRNRYMALICPTSETKMVRFLRHTANSSVRLLAPFDKISSELWILGVSCICSCISMLTLRKNR